VSDSTTRDLERLLAIESVAREILARWKAQEARAVAWQRLAQRARAQPSPNEREEILRDRETLDSIRVRDFGDLRIKLGEALGEAPWYNPGRD